MHMHTHEQERAMSAPNAPTATTVPAVRTAAIDPIELDVSRRPGRMRAIVQRRYGGADQLVLDETDRPTVGDDDVLIRVVAAGVDRGVGHLMTGRPYPTRLGFGLRRPRNPIPGLDVSGVVEAVGRGVTRFVEGDRVFGVARGSFAEYAVAAERKLAAAPHGLDPVAAGVLAVTGSTALQAIEDHGRVTAGQQVLVLGASGGVGTYAVQIARATGAVVAGTASTDKLDLVRALGAASVIDHRVDDPLSGDVRYDVIVDTGGNRRLRDLRRALAPDGTLVIVGGEGGGRWFGGLDRQVRAVAWSSVSKQRMTTFVASEDADHLERLAGLVEAGDVTPVIDRRFPLHRAADAMRYLESGAARGKVVLTVDDADPVAGKH